MSNVVDLDDMRPHVSLLVECGDVHVIPVELIKKWARGELVPQEDVIRAIINDWLFFLEAEPQEAER